MSAPAFAIPSIADDDAKTIRVMAGALIGCDLRDARIFTKVLWDAGFDKHDITRLGDAAAAEARLKLARAN